ncbi:probable sphingolipid transporter spinster homolog 2 [Papaver somniferum]|uniref:probable sphingolipid transporter spinster homolog 2 n=1 Tax=Papaver somniferum TaxID=3469 RepID=UPI000E6FE175|nr:probable sphingolipid transporter spinster homolog 2 [Papaver somniferum]
MAEPSVSEESESISVMVVSENTESALGTTNSGKECAYPKKKTTWCSPKVLLLIFCLMNLLNYVDRGVIASTGVNGTPKVCNASGECIAGKGIQGAFNLTNFQDGALSTAFMVGLLVASPIFASLAKNYNKPFRLIGVGLLIWTIATACCGVTSNFWNIIVCRMLVGVGEASFMSLAAPFIDDNAPVARKTFCLGLFYMCIPVGIAFGYVYGGFVASHLNWRCAFFGEAILMLPFIFLCFFMEPLQLKGFESGEATLTTSVQIELHEVKITEVSEQGKDVVYVSSGGGLSNNKISRKTYLSKHTIKRISRFCKDMIWKDIKVLLFEKVYVVSVLGYVAYTFVIGAYSYWGPKAGADIYHMTNPDMFFGVITVFCGTCGTLAGAYLFDRINCSIKNGFKLLTATTALGGACCFGAFCFKSMYGFLAFFVLGQLFLFAAQAPVTFICLHSVKPSLRPISLAISTVAIHIFGDVPSSPLVGRIQDQIHNWRTTALILTSIFGVAAAIWLIGIFLDSVDRYNEEDNASTNTEPVAAENTVEKFDEHSEI